MEYVFDTNSLTSQVVANAFIATLDCTKHVSDVCPQSSLQNDLIQTYEKPSSCVISDPACASQTDLDVNLEYQTGECNTQTVCCGAGWSIDTDSCNLGGSADTSSSAVTSSIFWEGCSSHEEEESSGSTGGSGSGSSGSSGSSNCSYDFEATNLVELGYFTVVDTGIAQCTDPLQYRDLLASTDPSLEMCDIAINIFDAIILVTDFKTYSPIDW